MSPARIGTIAAVASLVLDQGNKLWLIFGFDIAARQPVALAPFFDVVYAKNTGISYSLLSSQGAVGRWAIFTFTLVAVVFLCLWLRRATAKLVGLGLGLVIGGALGNAADRFAYGFVADFYYFHIERFSWYIFNLADVAIVLGVGFLLLESLLGGRAAKRADLAES
jgi:signal peptidase II